MAKQIKLKRYRNINLVRREAGDVLMVGKDIKQGHAETLVRIGCADWYVPKSRKPKAKK